MKLTIPAIIATTLIVACSPAAETPSDEKVSPLSWSHSQWVEYYNEGATLEENCDTDFPEDIQGVQLYTMNPITTVAQVLCGIHAYQTSHIIYRIDDNEITALTFEEVNSADELSPSKLVISPTYDPDTRTLYTFAKGRGIGDCGTEGMYEWTSETGGYFALVEYRLKEECDGEMDEWPIVYSL